MDLQSIAQNIRGIFTPSVNAIYTEPGVSYGPAQSRWTRDPINFGTKYFDDDTSGEYRSPPSLSRALSGFGQPIEKAVSMVERKPGIYINPLSKDIKDAGGVPDVIRHESAHAVMDKALDRSMDNSAMPEAWASANPNYASIMQAIAGKRAGDMPYEVPAYAAQRNYSQFGIDPKTRADYINTMVNQLQSVSPEMAHAYRRLAGVK